MQINKKLKNGKCESGKFGNERLYINGNDMFQKETINIYRKSS